MIRLTIPELQQRMAAGELSARALAEAYLQRIERSTATGPFAALRDRQAQP